MVYLINNCSGCGGYCCKVISLDVPIDRYPEFLGTWKRITPAQALERNPFLPYGLFRHAVPGKRINFFTCSELDKGGLCSVYEERPEICRGYPYYGRLEIAHQFVFPVPWCRFREDALLVQGIPFEFVYAAELVECYRDVKQFQFIGGLESSPLPPEFRPCRADLAHVAKVFELGKAIPLTPDSVPQFMVQELISLYRATFQRFYNRTAPKAKQSIVQKAVLFCLSIDIPVSEFLSCVIKFSPRSLVPWNHLNSPKLRSFVFSQWRMYGTRR